MRHLPHEKPYTKLLLILRIPNEVGTTVIGV